MRKGRRCAARRELPVQRLSDGGDVVHRLPQGAAVDVVEVARCDHLGLRGRIALGEEFGFETLGWVSVDDLACEWEHSGWLDKETKYTGYKRRFFKVEPHLLSYYMDGGATVLRGTHHLAGAEFDVRGVNIVAKGGQLNRGLVLKAGSDTEAQKWAAALRMARDWWKDLDARPPSPAAAPLSPPGSPLSSPASSPLSSPLSPGDALRRSTGFPVSPAECTLGGPTDTIWSTQPSGSAQVVWHYAGWLEKETQYAGYKRRFFKVEPHLLSYYTDGQAKDLKGSTPLGGSEFFVKGVNVVARGGHFTRQLVLKASSESEAKKWVAALCQARDWYGDVYVSARTQQQDQSDGCTHTGSVVGGESACSGDAQAPEWFVTQAAQTTVRAGASDGAVVAVLPARSRVEVLEILRCDDVKRVRARIATPPGWITIEDLQRCWRWTVPEGDLPPEKQAQTGELLHSGWLSLISNSETSDWIVDKTPYFFRLEPQSLHYYSKALHSTDKDSADHYVAGAEHKGSIWLHRSQFSVRGVVGGPDALVIVSPHIGRRHELRVTDTGDGDAAAEVAEWAAALRRAGVPQIGGRQHSAAPQHRDGVLSAPTTALPTAPRHHSAGPREATMLPRDAAVGDWVQLAPVRDDQPVTGNMLGGCLAFGADPPQTGRVVGDGGDERPGEVRVRGPGGGEWWYRKGEIVVVEAERRGSQPTVSPAAVAEAGPDAPGAQQPPPHPGPPPPASHADPSDARGGAEAAEGEVVPPRPAQNEQRGEPPAAGRGDARCPDAPTGATGESVAGRPAADDEQRPLIGLTRAELITAARRVRMPSVQLLDEVGLQQCSFHAAPDPAAGAAPAGAPRHAAPAGGFHVVDATADWTEVDVVDDSFSRCQLVD